jgi:hypothetical protein
MMASIGNRATVDVQEDLPSSPTVKHAALNGHHPCHAVEIVTPILSKHEHKLEGFQSDFERLFCDVAAFFNNFGTSVDRLVGEIECFMAKDPKRPLVATVERGRELASSYREESTTLMRLTEGFVSHTNTLMHAIALLAFTLKQMGKISARVRLVGFNAFTAAAHLGSESVALSVLARKLTDLAQDDGVVASRLAALADSLATRIEEIAKVRSRMEALAREGLDQSGLPVSEISSTVECIVAELQSIAETAKRMRRTMSGLMLGLQRQDILRQGTDHIRLVLRALCEEHSLLPQPIDLADADQRARVATFLLFQERAATLAAALLEVSQAELRSLVDETRAGVEEMAAALRLLAGVRAKVEGDLRSKVRAPAALFEQLGHNLDEQAKEALLFRAVVDGMPGLADQLQSDFTCLHEIRIQLRAVRVLMRTEIARSPAAAGTASIVAEIASGEEEMGTFLAVNRKETGQMLGALHAIVEAADRVRRHRQHLAVMESGLRVHPEEIFRAGAEFGCRFQGVARMSAGMEETLQNVGEGLATFQTQLGVLSDLQQVCEELAGAAAQRRIELFGVDAYDGQLPPGRLSEIIEHFTVFSHKQMGGEVAGVSVAQGDAGGTLTLF